MEKLMEDLEDISETTGCEDACEECNCFTDPEDAFWNLEKMTREEKKEYLNELLRNRSVGC